jgi:hypothetical protein
VQDRSVEYGRCVSGEGRRWGPATAGAHLLPSVKALSLAFYFFRAAFFAAGFFPAGLSLSRSLATP